MRDSGMSSSASTSNATIVKRTTVTPNGNTQSTSQNSSQKQNTSPPSGGSKCRCCPYGFHIDLGFVSYAQDVSNGFISRQGTPTNTHHRQNGGDRPLMSPLDSIFSDSLENIMSDFEEALAPHKAVEQKIREKDMQEIRNRLQNGYSSDYTAYRRGISTAAVKQSPIARPTALNQSGSRSNTPVLNGKFHNHNNNNNTSGYATALAKTVSEIRARNSESPFPDSRVGTPIDLGLPPSNFNSNGNGFHHQSSSNHCTTPSRLFRHDDLPPTPTPLFRRAPSQGDLPRNINQNGSSNGSSNEFASLRRGREYALPETEPRVRFFSASPKLPRRLQLAPSMDVESHFTYTQQTNGQPVLARTQATSPPPENEFVPIQKSVATRSIAVTTGPLPAPKPCVECSNMRKELKSAIERIPPPRGKAIDSTTSTETIILEEKSVGSEPIAFQHVSTGTEPKVSVEIGVGSENFKLLHVEVQTDEIITESVEPVKKITVDMASSPIPFDEPVKTTELGVQTVLQSSNSFASQTDAVTAENDEVVIATSSKPASAECQECTKRQDVFTRNVGVGSCSVGDRICVSCDENVEETDENEAPGFKAEVDEQKQREFEIAKNIAVKKLLTNEQKSNFQRGTAVSKSARYDRQKSVDDLDYIIDKNRNKQMSNSTPATSSIPENSEALKSKVVLKKELVIPPSKAPEPISARIPRPKISKWATPEEAAETPDEEEEAQDRLTPLRSELRPLGPRWARNAQQYQQSTANTNTDVQEDISDSDAESDCSAHSDGTFDVTDDVFDAAPFEVSDKLREALENFNSNILESGSVPEETVEWSDKLVQHEWMKTAARKNSRYEHVDRFVEELKNLGPKMVHTVVNLCDQNDNTALHYAVSHANFPVVSSILDCGEVELDIPNRAGYTAVMLAALSSLEDDLERAVVQRLFEMGNVNSKATQHGQTALMLAVSHGKKATTELLLICGADVNIQDEEGSTALMCAAEHGHHELVKLLLSQSSIDASLVDCDHSTALSIAVENGHRDIGVLIYAHQNYAKLDNFGPTSTI